MKLRTITWLLILLGCAGAVTAQTEKTCPPPPGPLTGEQWVSRLDADGDGRVSAAEFDGPVEYFARLDRDSDGLLVAAEAPPGPPPPPPPPPRQDPKQPGRGPGPRPRPMLSFVERLDQDHDGQVSAAEFDGPAESFADFDRDGDGFISTAEAPQGPPPGCPPPPPRPPRRQD